MTNTTECDVTEAEVDKLMNELGQELGVEDNTPIKPNGQSFWQNLKKSWTKPKEDRKFALRLQRLAGIITDKDVAALILPDGQTVIFKQLPSWKDVIRYKIAGLTYETYE
jgi:hypothetical protein